MNISYLEIEGKTRIFWLPCQPHSSSVDVMNAALVAVNDSTACGGTSSLVKGDLLGSFW